MARPAENLSEQQRHPGAVRGQREPALAQDIARHLGTPLGRASVGRFSDGEVNIEIMENVRGRDVFIIQPTCPPANDT